MMSEDQNRTLTRVGKGTPMGELLRRYWYPVAAEVELEQKWTKRVRLLGEDLVLYRDRSGNLGLIAEKCPHRGASMVYGIPETDGIRCAYHGWYFDATGQCIEQPNEPETSTFKERIRISGYRVEKLGGLIFAYLGPDPAPLLPRYDAFAVDRAIRVVGQAILPVNFLQVMENSLDPVHTEWLHGHYHEFIQRELGGDVRVAFSRHHIKTAFDVFEHGIVKRRLLEGQSEDSDDWRIGHPVVFPYMLAVGSGGLGTYAMQMRIPMDDTHTWHVWYNAYVPGEHVEIPQSLQKLCLYDVPWRDAEGEFITDYIDGQDIAMWVTQGTIADRTTEHLGTTDKGIILLRKLYMEQIQRVQKGLDPLGVIRDPSLNGFIKLPLERKKHHFSEGFESVTMRFQTRFCPIAKDLINFFEKTSVAQ
ncbi:Rieske 2Fe-2S domain-containing protein [Alicyclobacillus dauci]|uniref:Rieske 2Fe-2S domain-containing protein n=1 Tax=Alicyclobacillus dauci TaxID=1475485 RepID=A0ABY6Z7J6_9BACL|nr:Rieske 2Fe-2S domain-containing protein [Alicyclobacillus dauci]WAH37985.1 Rieske 2Fe-2S domain-containing protein [Alicyclobacillus dauci]